MDEEVARGSTQVEAAKQLRVSKAKVSRRVRRLADLWSAWKSRNRGTEGDT